MANYKSINEEAGLGPNWVPLDRPPIVPGRTVGAPPASDLVPTIPQYFQGSIAPNFQHDVHFVDTATLSSNAPKFSLMPLGPQQNAVSATQITSIVKTSSSGPSPDIDWYQEIQANGVFMTQRPILNFLADHVLADNATNNSTDVELGAFTGDVAKGAGLLATTVIAIQGVSVSTTAPTNDQVLTFDSGTNKWTPKAAVITSDIHQVGHGFSTGQAVYFTGSTWALAEANAVGTLGIGVIVVLGANDFVVYYSGPISGLSGLTAGQYYFVSDATPGLLTATEPTARTSFSNPLLFALTTTSGIVLPFRPAQIPTFSVQIVNENSNYSAQPGDIVLCDTSAGGFTVTMPASATNSTRRIVVKKISTDNNALIIVPSGLDSIDGAASQIILTPKTAIEMVADGSATWEII